MLDDEDVQAVLLALKLESSTKPYSAGSEAKQCCHQMQHTARQDMQKEQGCTCMSQHSARWHMGTGND